MVEGIQNLCVDSPPILEHFVTILAGIITNQIDIPAWVFAQ
jgi:hypothetical protein